MNSTRLFKITLWMILLLICGIRAEAQSTQLAAFTTGFEPIFNTDDVFFGFSAGAESPKYNGSLTAGIDVRLGTKKVLIEQPFDNLYYQYRERRYILWTGLEKRMKFLEFNDKTSLQVFGYARGGFSFGDYRATKVKPESGFLLIPGGGLALRTYGVLLKLGYQRMNLGIESVAPHWVYLGVNFIILE